MIFRAMLALALGLGATAFQAPTRLTTSRAAPLKSAKITTSMSYTSQVRRQGQRLMDDVVGAGVCLAPRFPPLVRSQLPSRLSLSLCPCPES